MRACVSRDSFNATSSSGNTLQRFLSRNLLKIAKDDSDFYTYEQTDGRTDGRTDEPTNERANERGRGRELL